MVTLIFILVILSIFEFCIYAINVFSFYCDSIDDRKHVFEIKLQRTTKADLYDNYWCYTMLRARKRRERIQNATGRYFGFFLSGLIIVVLLPYYCEAFICHILGFIIGLGFMISNLGSLDDEDNDDKLN